MQSSPVNGTLTNTNDVVAMPKLITEDTVIFTFFGTAGSVPVLFEGYTSPNVQTPPQPLPFVNLSNLNESAGGVTITVSATAAAVVAVPSGGFGLVRVRATGACSGGPISVTVISGNFDLGQSAFLAAILAQNTNQTLLLARLLLQVTEMASGGDAWQVSANDLASLLS